MNDEQKQQEAEMHRLYQEYMQRVHAEQLEFQRKVQDAQRWAQVTQNEINNMPRTKYAAIVAVDLAGSFAKDGKIPWNYPEDFKWFQGKTQGHICVMGRTTYEDITNHLGDKAAKSVLPGRKCFVVTSRPLEKDNAIAIANLGELEKHLSFEERETKTVFICGGEGIYSEGIAYCDTLYITVVNKDVEGDRKFPIAYTLKHFDITQEFKHEGAPDLKFTVWKRK